MDHVVEATTTTTAPVLICLLSPHPRPGVRRIQYFLVSPKAAANVINKMVYIRYLWFPIQTQSITAYGLDYTKYWCLAQIHILGHCCQYTATPSLPPTLRSCVNIYRISIKTSAQLECSDRMTPAAARVSLTWKWYEIVYEKNFVWGNCLLNQRGPHYKFSWCCRRVQPVPSGCTSASTEQHTSRSRWCRDTENFG